MKMNRIEEYLTCAMAGTLIGQMSAKREIPLETLVGPRSRELRQLEDDLDDIGIDPPLIAQTALLALATLFANPKDAELITDVMTKQLWKVLGDPSSGDPPEIYRRAGASIHFLLIQLLQPDTDD